MERAHEPVANERADEADDDIADDPVAGTAEDRSRKPPSDAAGRVRPRYATPRRSAPTFVSLDRPFPAHPFGGIGLRPLQNRGRM